MNIRRLALTFCVLAVAGLAAPASAGPWFDLENCEMCKQMTAEEGLMEHMQWENHLTKDGMVSITTVDPGYEEAFQRSMKHMQAVGEKMMAGEKVQLCGFCQSYGGLHMAGADFEQFPTQNGAFELISSHDPAIVAKIHKHGQTTIDEYKKMFGAEGEGEHKEHPHGEHKDHPQGDH